MLCRKQRSEYLYNYHTHVIYVIGILGVDTDEPPSANGPPDPDIYSPAAPSPSSVGSADPRLRKRNISSKVVETNKKRGTPLRRIVGSMVNKKAHIL